MKYRIVTDGERFKVQSKAWYTLGWRDGTIWETLEDAQTWMDAMTMPSPPPKSWRPVTTLPTGLNPDPPKGMKIPAPPPAPPAEGKVRKGGVCDTCTTAKADVTIKGQGGSGWHYFEGGNKVELESVEIDVPMPECKPAPIIGPDVVIDIGEINENTDSVLAGERD